MLVVIAVGSVLLGIASGLLVLLMSVEQSSRESLRQQVALANLAGQFRRDVRGCTRMLPPDGKTTSPRFPGRVGQAREASAGPPSGAHSGPALARGALVPPYSAGWRFEAAEGTIVQYRVQGTSLIRVLVNRGVVLEQEAYQLPEDAQVSLEISATHGPAIVSLLIAMPKGKPARGAPSAVEIDAAMAADLALLETAAQRTPDREVPP
jgi:type II secretory pathway component PulJ